jgi:uncharacterized membrane protein
MMSRQTNILIALICLILVGHSWYVHYRVKDGIARIMLLWGCGMVFAFIFVRMLTYILLDFGVIDGIMVNLIFTYNVWLIYAIVIGQQYIQRSRSERNEDDKLQKDMKELIKRRRKE